MSPTSSTNSTQTQPAGTTAAASPAASPTVSKNMFLQLLVAQIKNQDPLQPTDGAQFVAQLAQFQQLEQSVNSGQDLTVMRQDLDMLVAALNSGNPVTHS